MGKEYPQRKSPRYKDYDYNLPGYYFITTCIKDRIGLFGKIINEKMFLNKTGFIVQKHLLNLPKYYLNCELDCYVIMPDHVHSIIIVNPIVGDGLPVPYGKNGSITDMMGYFKYQSTKEINESLNTPGKKIWQRSFYDHIILNEKELYYIRNDKLNLP